RHDRGGAFGSGQGDPERRRLPLHVGALMSPSLVQWRVRLFGTRQFVGPFTAPGAAGVTANTQTNLDCRYSHIAAAAATSFVATRAGSIVGLSVQLSAKITGAGGIITTAVTVNGTEVACTVALSTAGDSATGATTVTPGTLTFVAGDVIGVSYTSADISNTPTLVATIEIES